MTTDQTPPGGRHCRRCMGTGESFPCVICPDCAGYGTIGGPPPAIIQYACGTCNGRSKHEHERACTACTNTGIEPVDRKRVATERDRLAIWSRVHRAHTSPENVALHDVRVRDLDEHESQLARKAAA